jgi:hypothetical protein
MTIDREMLAAYAEGQLADPDRAVVEAAIATDPILAEEVASHQALKARLQAHFAPVLDSPVPDRLLDAVRENTASTAKIVSLDAARATRAEKRGPLFTRWITGGAIAASLAVGLLLGTQIAPKNLVGQVDGKLVAQAALDTALTGQLASADMQPVHILLSFKDSGGRYCRVFDATTMAGLACRDADRWAIDRMQSGGAAAATGQYRQAGSALSEIMAAAQSMAPEGALTSDQEKAAMDKGWR